MIKKYYLKLLDVDNKPTFLTKYLQAPSLLRLRKIGFFCGMDFASKNIYNFKEYISRYDHSLSVALLTYKLTHDKKATLAGLFHDISTPCFSHVIDFMNEDYIKQETTEKYTKNIIMKDKYLIECLKEDNIGIDEVEDFKKYPIVDSPRPRLCADRLDGLIYIGTTWTQNLVIEEIKEIIDDLTIVNNEDEKLEIAFKSLKIAQKVKTTSEIDDQYCSSKEDNYMMLLLAKIVKLLIKKGYIKYEDLYIWNEDDLISLLNMINDEEIRNYFYIFKTIKKQDIPNANELRVKKRVLDPLVVNKRLSKLKNNN